MKSVTGNKYLINNKYIVKNFILKCSRNDLIHIALDMMEPQEVMNVITRSPSMKNVCTDCDLVHQSFIRLQRDIDYGTMYK